MPSSDPLACGYPVAALVLVAGLSTCALAQSTPGGAIADTAANLAASNARTPRGLDLTLFSDTFSDAMFVHGQYEWIDEGFELEQGLGGQLSLLGRAYGNHLLFHYAQDLNNPEDPFEPPTDAQSYFHFGLLQAGIGLGLGEQTKLTLLGGGYVGDIGAASAEIDLSSTVVVIQDHPVNFLYTFGWDSETDVSSVTLEFRAAIGRFQDVGVYAGPGGFIYGGGDIGAPDGGAGAIFGGTEYRVRAGAELQGGYGTLGAYAMLSLWKSFSW